MAFDTLRVRRLMDGMMVSMNRTWRGWDGVSGMYVNDTHPVREHRSRYCGQDLKHFLFGVD